MKKILLALLAVSLIGISGCTSQVPPGHKGKILGVNGYNAEVLGEGRHSTWGRDHLVLLDLTTNRKTMGMGVTMRDYDSEGKARPGLKMDFTLSFRYRLRDDAAVINTMFHDIKVDKKKGVTSDAVFGIYAQPIIETAFRDVISQYTPEETLANRGKINQEVGVELNKRLAKSPIEVSDAVVTRMTLPTVISDRLIANKDRELQIAQEEAQQAIELLKRDNGITLAHKDAEKNLIDAQAAAAQNKALNSGLSDQVLELRRLEIAKIQAEALYARMTSGATGDVVFMPYSAMNSVGSQVRMMNAK
ncbi:MAG: SPFH domain-containing protein [Piscirickettsiaceae bacterium]|nr:SPFH domain-containing protein [Piscirickettsiaceae bacterium]